MNDQAGRYAVNTEAIDYYIKGIVNPALDNFNEVLRRLQATTAVSRQWMLGHRRLRGSTEFTDTCAAMLDTFFETHSAMTDQQQNLVRTITDFRETLQDSVAAYVRSEAEATQFLGSLSTRLDGEVEADGTP